MRQVLDLARAHPARVLALVKGFRPRGLLPRRRQRREDIPVRQNSWWKPARLFVLLFLAVDLAGTALLMTPLAGDLTFVQAFFTSTSALAVCGLSVIDLGRDLTAFGHLVVLVLIQVGGIGIMTMASLMGAAIIHRSSLRMDLGVQAESRSPAMGDTAGIGMRVIKTCAAIEGITVLLVLPRMWLGYDMAFHEALYSSVFHAVSAFNNAGLSLYGDSLTRFSGDAFVLFPLAGAVILGGIGFPVLIELRRHLRTPRRWTLHTKLTVTTSAILFLITIVLVVFMEWSNPRTLGELGWWARITDGTFHGIMPRSGGFNVVDTGAMHDSTLLLTIMMMFVGGGSGGTAGGIKVGTLAVIFLVVWSEVRAHDRIHVFGRRLPNEVVRQSLSLTFLSMTFIAVSTVVFMHTTPFSFVEVLFEVVSAVGVVGLSTGITPVLAPWAQLLLAVLMIAGRIGPITFATAIAFRERKRRYDLAEARPVIG
ncbi:TrkH family potassium uptake protein [Nocardiopsis algeriensis]|uniref:Trk-type K+ transport system membrane component n=1 Tax=Nocardiopsis algeriensis TaxID=1478215 RepID=A0A841IWT2_9ACTN|nr:potassium transporter TrkG [Nocardiopsis algeriensis]MBB6120668.1 Trk-type K+ transport system membrane component [Nocardiopsis algeriensis]